MSAKENTTWTRKLIIQQILQHEADHKSLRSKAIKKLDYALYSAAIRKFGSWSQAVTCAGVPFSKYYKTISDRKKSLLYWTPDKIIEEILQRALKRQSLQSTKVQPLALRMAAIKFYGTWAGAVRAAGLNPTEHRCYNERKFQKWTREKIKLEILKRAENGLGLHSREVRNQDRCLFFAAKRHFGSWAEALCFAGLHSEIVTAS